MRRLGTWLLCSAMLTGCASFPQHQVSPVQEHHSRSDEEPLPLVYVDLRFYEGTPDHSTPDDMAYGTMIGIARQAFIASGRFADVQFQRPSINTSIPYYRLSIYEETPMTVPVLTGLLCVLSYDLIPMFATQHLDVVLQHLNAETGSVEYQTTNSDTIHSYFGWLAIPARLMGKTQTSAFDSTVENQITALLQQDHSDDSVAPGV